ncbi:hypothetical protein [Bradyrhizobium sp.]|jgi:hypothetical protein|uniref:hypothetical protein n=1 Tax=Bradyrhizobium sp. TaxID=376 RepID=UPI003D0D644B
MRAAFALGFLIATTSTALADSLPVIVIPGRAGVPIIINGVDASYAVVEGDWGLGKGLHMQPTVYGGHPVDPEPNVGHYYPSSGHLPGYGRLEIEPPSNGRPKQAESFHQSWSAQSTPQPVQPAVPFYPPPVIVAPQHHEAVPQDPANPPQDFQYRKPRKLPQ